MELLEWDAAGYDSLPLPHTRWGAGVIARLAPAAGELVLDLGCGTGRDAERLLAAAPGARVLGVDGSGQMLARARERFADCPERVTFQRADLRAPLRLEVPVDAVMSVAALHWLPDHRVVFESVARALPPGGRFVAECGGRGNIAEVHAALAQVGAAPEPAAWQFAGAEETAARLAAAGFVAVSTKLVDDPAVLERGEQLERYLATVVLGATLRELPPDQRRPFVAAVAAALPEPVIDYVRLQLTARLPAPGGR